MNINFCNNEKATVTMLGLLYQILDNHNHMNREERVILIFYLNWVNSLCTVILPYEYLWIHGFDQFLVHGVSPEIPPSDRVAACACSKCWPDRELHAQAASADLIRKCMYRQQVLTWSDAACTGSQCWPDREQRAQAASADLRVSVAAPQNHK